MWYYQSTILMALKFKNSRWIRGNMFWYIYSLKTYISKHQHHKKSALNFHISKSTGHKNTRNQAPPFAIDLNENLIAYTFGVHTKSPFETIDNNTKNSVSIVQWTEISRNANFALRSAKYNFAKFSVRISRDKICHFSRISCRIKRHFDVHRYHTM